MFHRKIRIVLSDHELNTHIYYFIRYEKSTANLTDSTFTYDYVM